MTHHETRGHEGHTHRHGPGCGHTAIRHEGHIDYLHDGHLHHPAGEHVEEHRIEVSRRNPERCTPEQECAHHAEHGGAHGRHHHPAIPHGDHVDYLHEGRLHHHHGDHCDDHGPVEVVEHGPER